MSSQSDETIIRVFKIQNAIIGTPRTTRLDPVELKLRFPDIGQEVKIDMKSKGPFSEVKCPSRIRRRSLDSMMAYIKSEDTTEEGIDEVIHMIRSPKGIKVRTTKNIMIQLFYNYNRGVYTMEVS